MTNIPTTRDGHILVYFMFLSSVCIFFVKLGIYSLFFFYIFFLPLDIPMTIKIELRCAKI